MNFAELNQIRDAYQKYGLANGLRLMVGFNRRFSPLVQTCKEAIDKVNSPISMILTVNAGIIPADHWTQDPEKGGGRIIGEACHFIDLLRHLAGSEIESVQSSFMHEQHNSKMPDTATITLTFKNGSLGTLNYFANGNKDFPKERIEIFADGGILQLDNFKALNSYGFKGVKKQSLWSQDKGHGNCAASFISSIANGKPCPIPFNEIYEVSKATLLAAGLQEEGQ